MTVTRWLKLVTVVCLLLTLSIQSGKAGCDDGWTVGTAHCYFASTASLSWNDANDECTNNGSHLASIEDNTEKTFLADTYKSGDYWLGAKDGDTTFTDGTATGSFSSSAGNGVTLALIDIGPGGILANAGTQSLGNLVKFMCKKVKPCDVPNVVDATPSITVNSSVAINTTVLYNCTSGYLMSNGLSSVAVECGFGNSWTPSLSTFNCSLSFCAAALNVDFSTFDTNDTSLLTNVTITCDERHRFAVGVYNQTVRCQNDGTWTAMAYANCEVYKCPPLPTVAHSSPSSTDISLNASVTITCDSGYWYAAPGVTQQTITCNGNGTWTPLSYGTCIVPRCAAVSSILQGTSDSTANVLGSIVTYSCDSGYEFPDGSKVKVATCNNDGTWNIAVQNCQPVVCPVPQVVANATSDSTNRQYQSVITYTCNLGFAYPSGGGNVKQVTCQSNAQWDQTIPSACTDIDCSPIQTGAFSTYVGNVTSMGGVIDYTCNPGYEFPFRENSTSINCTAAGVWSASLFDCELPSCYALVVPRASPQTNVRVVGTAVTVLCDQGYDWPVNTTITPVECLPSQAWNYTPPACEPMECVPAPVVLGTNATAPATTVESIMTYTCKNGYYWPDGDTEKFILCEPTLQWNTTPPACEKLKCPLLSPVQMSTKDTIERTFETVVTVTCNQGFEFPGGATSMTTTCNSQLVWGTAIPAACVRKMCWAPPSAQNTVVLGTGTGDYQSVLEFKCKEGYRFPSGTDVTYIYCTNTGDWSLTLVPDCEEIECSNPGFTMYSLLDVYKKDLWTNITYTCDWNAKLPGGGMTTMITCMPNGQWDKVPNNCYISKCPEEPGWYLDSATSQCYFMSSVVGATATFDQAVTACNQKQAAIVTISSDAENTFVLDNGPKVYNKDHWIGLKETSNLTIWKWISDQTLPAYDNWFLHEPDGDGSCARMSKSGIWKDRRCSYKNAYVCETIAVCPENPSVANAVPEKTVTGAGLGVMINYTCNLGYVFPNGSVETSIVCMNGGFWSAIESCQAVDCPAVQSVANAVPSSYQTIFETQVTYNCFPGYWFSKEEDGMSRTMTCLPNATWDVVIPPCTPRECAAADVPGATSGSISHPIGSQVIFTCNTGFEFNDTSTQEVYTCLDDTTWSPNDVVCQVLYCPTYSHPNTVIDSDATRYQTKLMVTCTPGYMYADTAITKEVYCLADKTWTVIPACEVILCTPPPNVTHATPDTTDNQLGSVLNYTCDEGFSFIDGSKFRLMKCDGYAEWSPASLPSCTDSPFIIEFGIEHPLVEAPGAVTIGAVGIVLMCVLAVFIIGCDVGTFGMHLVTLKANLFGIRPETTMVKEPKPKKPTKKKNPKIQKEVRDTDAPVAPLPGTLTVDPVLKPEKSPQVKKYEIPDSADFEDDDIDELQKQLDMEMEDLGDLGDLSDLDGDLGSDLEADLDALGISGDVPTTDV